MTIWKPRLIADGEPIYQGLASSIGQAVERGELRPGDRLPTQREMSDRLGIALTTVTRGYAEAERCGWVRGEVGRGTFVRGATSITEPDGEQRIDLRPNSLLPNPLMPDLSDRIARIVQHGDTHDLFGYGPHRGRDRHREAGATWIEQAGLETDAADVLVTAGAQHAMAVVLGTITDPGDTLLVEDVTYAGMKALANLLHLRLEPLPMDEHGILPDALESALEETSAAALYCMSALQNPTSAVMTTARCREVAAIAAQHGLSVVEDDSYGFVLQDRTPLTAYCERGYYLTGTSKSLLPSLRIGFVRAPRDMVDRLEATISSTIYLASPLTGNLVAEWIDDGTATRVMDWKRQEIEERQRLAIEILADQVYRTHPSSPHGWLELPPPWSVRDFVAQAGMRGIDVTPSDEFAVGRDAPHAVRICTGPVPDRATLERGLWGLTEILADAPDPVTTLA